MTQCSHVTFRTVGWSEVVSFAPIDKRNMPEGGGGNFLLEEDNHSQELKNLSQTNDISSLSSQQLRALDQAYREVVIPVPISQSHLECNTVIPETTDISAGSSSVNAHVFSSTGDFELLHANPGY